MKGIFIFLVAISIGYWLGKYKHDAIYVNDIEIAVVNTFNKLTEWVKEE